MKSINLNDFVKVKLNRTGTEIYFNHYYNNLGGAFIHNCIPNVDKDGFTKMQLYEFMNIFGTYLFNGSNIPIDDCKLFFDDEVITYE